jgi:hypothetical protein
VTELRADCSRCRALCCVAPAFTRSADFPISKPAGAPCPNLAGFSCSVHTRLRPLGFAGCVAYDCFGAGQRVSRLPEPPEVMFGVLPVMRQLHELLWYLDEASTRAPSAAVVSAVASAAERVSSLASVPAGSLLALDVAAERALVAPLLARVAASVRGGRSFVDHTGADLAGASLAGCDLSYAVLRGALLIGADLRGAVLVGAELLGADLRGADLSGADLSEALFLTRSQVGAALGSPATVLPPAFDHPPHWR